MSRAARPGTRGGETGFTLFELLTVLAIVSLIAGVSFVHVWGGSNASSIKSIAHRSAAIFRESRASAINHQTQTAVIIDVGRRIVSGGRFGRMKVPVGIQMGVTTAARLRLSDRRAAIRFFPNGSSTGGTLKYGQGSKSIWVRVNWLTGRVSVE